MTPAPPLTQARITSIVGPDGQSMTYSGTTTNNPTVASIYFPAADPSQYGISFGPLPITLGTGTFTVSVDDIRAGQYAAPQLLFTNAGGLAQATGSLPFEIIGVGSLALDSGTSGGSAGPANPPAPVVSIATSDITIMSGKRATVSGSMDLQNDATGHVDLFLDPQPSGAPASLGAANVSSNTWTKQADIPPGLYKLRVVATANGQTASASTGNVRVLNLVGNFNLPA